ncbi:MAG: phospho-N-acetylmuramoyl-pentapeptide-transferase [Erysipelotrichaceae bacterium]|nr:phospho-N-acetylmuramoyl-pentapeptide-transferase [Erysipelotrichaceae bacterium]MBO4538419.1 phospho-N-acetylmuramoyl-pentapeptide-transferase [Erysipelotrichaceae bacterium]MBR5048672.1 phospho-N-acetylmuramoyl-pentapeptide-transferase [Erysipelotrichaceae bacterium]
MGTRMILAFGIGLISALLLYPVAIPILHKLKFGQTIYELGPKSHQVKAGTPPMGGVVFIITSLLASLIVQPKAFGDMHLLIVVLAFIGYGLIGFVDDFIIVVKHQHEGLTPRMKFLMQSVLAVVFFLLYRNLNDNTVVIPFLHRQIDLGWFYVVVVFIMFTGESNAVNLSDGLDGLCAGLVILALIPFVYFCFRAGLDSVAIFLCGVIGSLVGYLRYNIHPAQIFMGDTGSLALGGLLAAVAMVTKEEIALILIGGVFVVEVLSVMLQVASFQLTGKRIFRMSPLHHHFELGGWPETKVVHVFWAAGAVLCILGLVMGACM